MKQSTSKNLAKFKYIFFLSMLSIVILLNTGCSAIKNITRFNISETDITDNNDATKLSLPESNLVKDTLEITMNNPSSLNPLDPTDYTVDQVLKLIYDPLFIINSENGLEKKLVLSAEIISPVSMRITLKPNLTFQNNTPLESKDIIFSFNYIKEHPGTAYDYVPQFISTITEVDTTTFDVVFLNVDHFNPYSLTFPIISESYVTSKEYEPMQPVGSGMYICTRFQSMIDAQLELNTAYHDMKPSIKKISITITRKFDDGYNMFNSKRIDVFSPYQTNWHDYSNDTNLQISTYDSPFFYYIGMNLNHSILRVPDGRKLLATVIPYEKINKEAFLGHLSFTTLPILPSFQTEQKLDPYYSVNDENSYYMREYSSEKTDSRLKTLRALGYAIIDQVPITFDLIYNEDEMYQAYIAEQIEANNLDNPVHIRCNGLSTQAYYEALKNKDYDLFINTLKVALIPNLTSFYGTLGTENLNDYSNINLDGLLSSYRLVENDAGFIKQSENISQVVADQLPIIPLGFLQNGYFAHDQIDSITKTHYFSLYHNISSMSLK